jgi:hypothetical protein
LLSSPLPVGDPSLEPRGLSSRGKLAKITLCEQRRPQRLGSEEHEVGGAGQADREKERLRGHQQGGEPGTAGECPGREPGDNAERRGNAAATSANQGVADGEGRIRAGGDDDEERYAQECREVDAAHEWAKDRRKPRARCAGLLRLVFRP